MLGADENYADRISAAATAMLRSGDTRAARTGARVLLAAAQADPAYVGHLAGLLCHPDGAVRALAVSSGVAISGSMLDVLLHDPSPAVRAALAARSSDLPEPAREFLRRDRHLAVRHALGVGTETPGETDSEPASTTDQDNQ
jgi:hypothetical protein